MASCRIKENIINTLKGQGVVKVVADKTTREITDMQRFRELNDKYTKAAIEDHGLEQFRGQKLLTEELVETGDRTLVRMGFNEPFIQALQEAVDNRREVAQKNLTNDTNMGETPLGAELNYREWKATIVQKKKSNWERILVEDMSATTVLMETPEVRNALNEATTYSNEVAHMYMARELDTNMFRVVAKDKAGKTIGAVTFIITTADNTPNGKQVVAIHQMESFLPNRGIGTALYGAVHLLNPTLELDTTEEVTPGALAVRKKLQTRLGIKSVANIEDKVGKAPNSLIQSLLDTYNRLVLRKQKSTKENISLLPNNSDENTITNLLNILSKKFNLPYNIIDDPSIEWKGQFSKGQVTVNLAQATNDTPLHEYSHVLLQIIRNDNPKLYAQLRRELSRKKDTADVKKATEYVDKYYPELEAADKEDEVLAILLSNYAIKDIKDSGLLATLKEAWDYVQEMLIRLIRRGQGSVRTINVTPDQLDPTTSLEQLGNALADPFLNIQAKPIMNRDQVLELANQLKEIEGHFYNKRLQKGIAAGMDIQGHVEPHKLPALTQEDLTQRDKELAMIAANIEGYLNYAEEVLINGVPYLIEGRVVLGESIEDDILLKVGFSLAEHAADSQESVPDLDDGRAVTIIGGVIEKLLVRFSNIPYDGVAFVPAINTSSENKAVTKRFDKKVTKAVEEAKARGASDQEIAQIQMDLAKEYGNRLRNKRKKMYELMMGRFYNEKLEAEVIDFEIVQATMKRNKGRDELTEQEREQAFFEADSTLVIKLPAAFVRQSLSDVGERFQKGFKGPNMQMAESAAEAEENYRAYKDRKEIQDEARYLEMEARGEDSSWLRALYDEFVEIDKVRAAVNNAAAKEFAHEDISHITVIDRNREVIFGYDPKTGSDVQTEKEELIEGKEITKTYGFEVYNYDDEMMAEMSVSITGVVKDGKIIAKEVRNNGWYISILAVRNAVNREDAHQQAASIVAPVFDAVNALFPSKEVKFRRSHYPLSYTYVEEDMADIMDKALKLVGKKTYVTETDPILDKFQKMDLEEQSEIHGDNWMESLNRFWEEGWDYGEFEGDDPISFDAQGSVDFWRKQADNNLKDLGAYNPQFFSSTTKALTTLLPIELANMIKPLAKEADRQGYRLVTVEKPDDRALGITFHKDNQKVIVINLDTLVRNYQDYRQVSSQTIDPNYILSFDEYVGQLIVHELIHGMLNASLDETGVSGRNFYNASLRNKIEDLHAELYAHFAGLMLPGETFTQMLNREFADKSVYFRKRIMYMFKNSSQVTAEEMITVALSVPEVAIYLDTVKVSKGSKNVSYRGKSFLQAIINFLNYAAKKMLAYQGDFRTKLQLDKGTFVRELVDTIATEIGKDLAPTAALLRTRDLATYRKMLTKQYKKLYGKDPDPNVPIEEQMFPNNKGLNFDVDEESFLNQLTEEANSKVFKKIDALGKSINKNTSEDNSNEKKLQRMREAFPNAEVLEVADDKGMEDLGLSPTASGVLLPTNSDLAKLYGKDVIVINTSRMFSDTVFHEFGHLYIDILGELGDPMIDRAISELRGTELYEEVANRTGLTGVDLDKEVLAEALGKKADEIFETQEERTVWQQILDTLYGMLEMLFNYGSSRDSLEQLATQMLSRDPRLDALKRYQEHIARYQKYEIDDPSQEEIDKLFTALTEDFTLDEASHNYINETTGEIIRESVSKTAKNMAVNYFSNKKGSWDINFSPLNELNKDNLEATLEQSKIPHALDQALDDYFKNKIPGTSSTLALGPDTYWYNEYLRIKSLSKADLGIQYNLFMEGLKRDLDKVNQRAYEIQSQMEIPKIAGNYIHKAIESYINDDEPIPEHLGELGQTIQKIIDEGKANGSKFYAEQQVFSSIANKPGTIDLVEITKDGKFRIYDFKTHKNFRYVKGKEQTLENLDEFQMFVKNGYLNQLLIYSTILQEYGIEPADNHLNILAMEVDHTLVDPEDLETLTSIKVNKLIVKNINPEDKVFAGSIAKAKNAIIPLFQNPSQLTKDLDLGNTQKEVERLAKKIARGISDYKEITNPYTGKYIDSVLSENIIIDKIADDIEQMIEKNNAAIILSYINNMRDAMISVYANSTERGDGLTTSYLANLEFLIQAASYLDDVRQLVLNADSDFTIDYKTKEDLLAILNETEVAVDKVIKFANAKTKELAVATLANNSNYQEGKAAQRFELEALEKGEDPDAYIIKKLRENKDLLLNAEYQYWANILYNGYTDIRALEYFLADPGMNKSQLVQVTKNMMDKVDQAVRIDLDREIADLVEWHANLNIDTKGDPKKVWGKFYEDARYKPVTYDRKTRTFKEEEVRRFKAPRLVSKYTSAYREVYIAFKDKIDYLDREIQQAQSKDDRQYEEDLKKLKQETIAKRDAMLVDAPKTPEIHPYYARLTKEEQKVLDQMHERLKAADKRLYANPKAKLVREVGNTGQLIYNLPKVRKSYLEAGLDTPKSYISRIVSGVRDFFRPPADEDELNIKAEEVDGIRVSNTDILGNPMYDVPIFYRNQLEDPDMMSFDLPTLLALNEETTIQYEQYKLIEADLFNIVRSIDPERGGVKADRTDPYTSKKMEHIKSNKLVKPLTSQEDTVLKAVKASINNRFYKRKYLGVYSKNSYKKIKAVEGLRRYNSMLLLAGNYGSAIMTGIQGSIYRIVERIAGEDMGEGTLRNGTKKAYNDLPNMITDTQKQFPTSKTNLLIRRFGLETQYNALTNKFVQDNIFKKNLDSDALYSITGMAESMVTASLMYSLLSNIKVMNKDGDYIDKNGNVVSRDKAMSLDEAYEVVEGKLVLNKNVAYTEFNPNNPYKSSLEGEKTTALTEVSRYIRSKYADLYGQYNGDMKSVAQMNVFGAALFDMRGWFMRGMHRRWRGIGGLRKYKDFEEARNAAENEFYSQDQKKSQQGYYVTGFRYLRALASEIKQTGFNLASMQNVKNQMTRHERANLKRFYSEFAIMAIGIVGSLLARAVALGMDDDDEGRDAVYFLAYLAERVKMESSTFINPSDTYDMFRTPAVAMSTVDRIMKFTDQAIFISFGEGGSIEPNILERYDRGAREGELKIQRQFQHLLPGYKKYSQAKGILGLDSKETVKDSFEYMSRN